MINWSDIKERLATAKDKAVYRFAYDGMSYNILRDGDVYKLRDDYTGKLLFAAKSVTEISQKFYGIHRFGMGR